MQIVIDIDEDTYSLCGNSFFISDLERSEKTLLTRLCKAVAKGIPLPQGNWIEKDDYLYVCSECGQYIYSETEHDLLEFHAFCGRCGAEMKGEEE